MRDRPTSASRRRFLRGSLAAFSGAIVAGCDRLGDTAWFGKILRSGETLTQATQRLIVPRTALAQEFTDADVKGPFRSNGTSRPRSAAYEALAARDFVEWRLKVDGLVERPLALSLDELKAMPSRTQITRHDCVEGWSAIAKWTGVPLADVLDRAKPNAHARYVVFHCADPMRADGTPYYESIDMIDAYHAQTILAYRLNDTTLPIANGAPIRVRVERQLGYKMAKYIMRIEVVSTFEGIGGGKGGYWEDRGYEWFAGI